MHDDTTEPVARTTTGAGTRQRILDAANELFYSHGIRATSADRIIEQVGITKVTCYRHFRTKSDLVVAYLEQQSAAERTWLEGTERGGDPIARARAIAADIGAASCSPGFRGCAFINAAAEFSDPDDPVRHAVAAHRQWMRGLFTDMAAQVGVSDVASVANQLMILRDGAMVNGYLGEAEAVAGSLEAAFLSILDPAASSRG